MKISSVFAVLVLSVVLACSHERIVTPRSKAANKDCDSRMCFNPTIDSISPAGSPFIAFDQPVGVFVCVYGSNLDEGEVYFNGSPVSTSVTGCGAMVFVAPITPAGDYPVFVNVFGVASNTVYFTRH